MTGPVANGHGTAQDWSDLVADLWFKTRHDAFAHRLQAERLVASKPAKLSALTAVLTERRDVMESDWRTLLPGWIEACRDQDPTIAARAKQWLRSVKNEATIDAICRHASQTGDPDSMSAAVDGDYAPSEAVEKSLFYYASQQWEKFKHADPHLQYLTAAYEKLGGAIKARFREIAVRTSRLELVIAMTRNFDRETITKLDNDDFEIAFQILLRNGEWLCLRRIAADMPARYDDSMWDRILETGLQEPEQLWQLAQNSPVWISLRCLQSLWRQNWRPQAADELRAAKSLFSLIDVDIASQSRPLILRVLTSEINPQPGEGTELLHSVATYTYSVSFLFKALEVSFYSRGNYRYTYALQGSSLGKLKLWRSDGFSSIYCANGIVECVSAYPHVLLDRSPLTIGTEELRTQASLLNEYSLDADRRLAECVLAVITWAQQQHRLTLPAVEAGRFTIVSDQEVDEAQQAAVLLPGIKAG